MIIGLTGKKGCGKNTVGDHLVNEYDFDQGGFADVLKQAVANLFGVTVEQADRWKNEYVDVVIESADFSRFGDSTRKHKALTWRELLQRFGTEMGRETFGPDFWVHQFWLNHDLKHSGLVITDVRFNNEAKSIKKRGGFIFEIIRPNSDMRDAHASESGISSKHIDATIYNKGTIAELYETVDELMSVGNYV